jgi:hypothetical protein
MLIVQPSNTASWRVNLEMSFVFNVMTGVRAIMPPLAGSKIFFENVLASAELPPDGASEPVKIGPQKFQILTGNC